MFFNLLIYWIYYCHSSHYYNYALQLIAQGKLDLRYYEFGKLQCIEMAIWPLLYTDEKWCESNISGQVYQKSVDFSFSFYCIKMFTNIDVQFISQSVFRKLFFNYHIIIACYRHLCFFDLCFLYFIRHPGYPPNTCFEQSCSPRFSIFPTILTSCISNLIGGYTRQCQVFSWYS